MIPSVTAGLIGWYDPDRRPLPWKSTRDPYLIWLSEIILQQTRVEQGTPYFLEFSRKYPNVEALASAPLDEVLKTWEGLGYYTRARNLHAAAKQVMEEFQGRFPGDHASLLRLKGVGEYTAAAIASFAYGEPVPVVDGNVYRVISRVFGISEPIDTTRGKKIFREVAEQLLFKEDPALYNQAIMDFGALVCRPARPLCDDCPFHAACAARSQDRVSLLPVKAKRIQQRERYFDFHVISDGSRVLVEQRGGNDVWKGLYQFPLLEFSDAARRKIIPPQPGWAGLLKLSSMSAGPEREGFRQVLTHQRIHARFREYRVRDLRELEEDHPLISAEISGIGKLAFPRIIHQYLDRHFRSLQKTGQS